MNHRSNMDYVLVAFLAAERTALSYAVGEWARIWPLQQLIRSMGAYFVRRNSNNPIYRRVLERYVHMATEAGVAQAMYPEGGLSRDGKLREPKLGLFDYMLKSFDPQGDARHRLRAGGAELRPRARGPHAAALARQASCRGAAPGSPRAPTLALLARPARPDAARPLVPLRLCLREFRRPGLGARLARQQRRGVGGDLRGLDKDQRFEVIGRLASDVMGEIARLVPVLPVSLIATVLLEAEEPLDELELKVRAVRPDGAFRGPRRQALCAARRPRLCLRCRPAHAGAAPSGRGAARTACSRRWRTSGRCSPTTPTPSPICADDAPSDADRTLWNIAYSVGLGFFTNRLSTSAAAMAFYTMFAHRPDHDLQHRRRRADRRPADGAGGDLRRAEHRLRPTSSQGIQRYASQDLFRGGGIAAIIGALVLVYTGSRVFVELDDGINAIWSTPAIHALHR